MNTPKSNPDPNARRLLPYFVEFVKFSVGFAVIVAIALVALHMASAATGG